MTDLIFNRDKSIGQVIYIVEGDKTEHLLLRRVFSILGYSVVSYNKNNDSGIYLQGRNKYSRVFIISAAHPSIVSLNSDKEYFDRVYRILTEEFALDPENSAVFYLFDRDRQSNRPKHIIPELEKKCNSRTSSDFDVNGLFLLSYPSIEAYLSTANYDNTELGCGASAKRYIEELGYSINDLDANRVLEAAASMISAIENITGIHFDAEQLDHFAEINKAILLSQDAKWARDHRYVTLSLLSASLIDLGIIECVDS